MSTSVLVQHLRVVAQSPTPSPAAGTCTRPAVAGQNFRQRHPFVVQVLIVIGLVVLFAVSG